MKISANAKDYELQTDTPLCTFLESLKLNPKRCLVELNGRALKPTEIFEIILKNGDKLEVLQLVAGG